MANGRKPMEIREINNFSEINLPTIGYCAEPSVEAAIAEFEQDYKQEPAIVWFRKTKSGRHTVYCSIEREKTDGRH